eukprot:1160252-Pelagomonas_calceolata.AAC.19
MHTQLLYNDMSPMENHHLAATFQILAQDHYNFLARSPKEVTRAAKHSPPPPFWCLVDIPLQLLSPLVFTPFEAQPCTQHTCKHACLAAACMLAWLSPTRLAHVLEGGLPSTPSAPPTGFSF